ncbi:anion permease [Bacillus sp. HNR-4]|uniref:SLC13 family permease n=1 Tax=Bacillus TaxID=1386 RepID=UPI000978847B|nr:MULTISPECIES: SLC13 family permease [Bacillus]ONH00460.1 sodium:solute symporter [Bacillus cereus]WDL94227.1 anion permease [Bacillus sp. HNR-4]
MIEKNVVELHVDNNDTPKVKSSWVLPVALILIVEIVLLLPSSLTMEAKWSLFGFCSAIILWTTTTINSAYIALGSVLFLIISGTAKQDLLFDSLASDVIWLMIGSFILGRALQITGLAEKMTYFVVNRARNISGLCWILTMIIQILAFFIPSTSGRAAVVLPVFQAICKEIGSRRIAKALAILMPTVILVSTSSTIIGAGSHLIALDMLNEFNNKNITFVEWLIWGLPFGIIMSFISCRVILVLFLDKEEVKTKLQQKKVKFELSRNEKYTISILIAMVAFWLTEWLHGLEIATVTIIGVFLLTLPKLGVMQWKESLKGVSWNLILFVGAAIALGKSLMESGAAQWIMQNLFLVTELINKQSTFIVLLVIVILSVTSHLYITSHTTRAVIFIPPLLYFASSLQLNEVAVLFLGIVGMNYCLTFPVSSKALLLFQESDRETFQPQDLLKLSSYLSVIYIFVMVIFYYAYWQWVGLSL